jgi:hypothetical protein
MADTLFCFNHLAHKDATDEKVVLVSQEDEPVAIMYKGNVFHHYGVLTFCSPQCLTEFVEKVGKMPPHADGTHIFTARDLLAKLQQQEAKKTND